MSRPCSLRALGEGKVMLLQAFFLLTVLVRECVGSRNRFGDCGVYFSVGLHAGSGVFQTSCSLRDLGVYGVSQNSGSLVGVTAYMEATM